MVVAAFSCPRRWIVRLPAALPDPVAGTEGALVAEMESPSVEPAGTTTCALTALEGVSADSFALLLDAVTVMLPVALAVVYLIAVTVTVTVDDAAIDAIFRLSVALVLPLV